jgi:hypothetical protein
MEFTVGFVTHADDRRLPVLPVEEDDSKSFTFAGWSREERALEDLIGFSGNPRHLPRFAEEPSAT